MRRGKRRAKMQNKEAEKEFFNQACEASPWVTFNENGQRMIFKLFAHLIQPKKGGKTLDLGCGTGEFSYELAELGLDVKGIDISKQSIEYCKAKYEKTIHFEVQDIEETTFENETFDILFYGGILHHFPKRERVFKEAYRILKKNGRLFAFDPNYYNAVIWIYRELLGIKKQKTENEVLIKPEEIRKELNHCSFSEIDVKSTANMTFDIRYFKKLVPFPLYYGVYAYNGIERTIQWIKPWREKHGSFVITIAKK